MYASAQYLKEGRQSPEFAALLQLASLLGINLTSLDRGDLDNSPAPILFAVMPLRSRSTKVEAVVFDYELCETARLSRLGYQTRSWFVVYSPAKAFAGGYLVHAKAGLLAVAGPSELLRVCTTALRLLTVPELQNIRTRGACSKARRLRHRLEWCSYNSAERNEVQMFCGNCVALQLLPAKPKVADKAAANRALDEILKNCERASHG